MAASELKFTKSWTSSEDFPTYEPDETRVRADMQLLFDEIKNHTNTVLLPDLLKRVPDTRKVNGHPLTEDVEVTKEDVGLGNVDNTSDEDKPISKAQQIALDAKANKTDVLQKDNTTPYTPTQPYHPSTKDYTDRAVTGAVMGQVPDGSITDKKLANDSVTEEKLSPGIRKSVTEDFPNHIADKNNPHGVTAEQVPYDNSRGELQSKNVQGAIDELYARMYGDLKVQVQVYETGTDTPISGVIVTGIASETGGVCYANEEGIATGYVLSDEQSVIATVKVDDRYIDLTGQTSQQVTVTKGVTATATIYATRVGNPDGRIETFTTSTQKMVTDKVNRVDVHCVGGGAGGQSGSAKLRSVDDGIVPSASGGYGGGAGKDSYQLSVGFTPNRLFSIVIGAHGTGGVADASGTSEQSAHNGTTGGATSCLEVVAAGGSINKTVGARANRYYPNDRDASEAASSANYIFGDESLGLVAGGDGGGGGARYNSNSNSDSSTGGSPNGGNGGGPTTPGRNAKGPGGGGGGGGARTDDTAGTYFYGYNGGNGGDGTVYVRWFYT